MRKVKDFIEEYGPQLENYTHHDDEILPIYSKILSEIVDETIELSKSRKVGTPSAAYSVINEQNKKWLKIRSGLNMHETYSKMYLEVLSKLMPKAEEMYREEKEKIRKRKEEKLK